MSLWISSVAYSAAVLSGYRVLEEPAAPWVIGLLSLVHLGIFALGAPFRLPSIVLSHTLMVGVSIVAITLHTFHFAGNPAGWRDAVIVFAEDAVRSRSFYVLLFVQAAVLLALGAALAFAFKHGLRQQRQPMCSSYLQVVYVLSALNVIYQYSLVRPLYNVSVEEGGEALYVVAGLFGLEISLPLHLIFLSGLIAENIFKKRRIERPGPTGKAG